MSDNDSESESYEKKTDNRSLNDERLLKVYEQASNWLRMSNTIFWTISAIFFPANVYLMFTALKEKVYPEIFCAASWSIYFLHLSMVFTYGASGKISRKALIQIERLWFPSNGHDPENKKQAKEKTNDNRLAFFSSQGFLDKKWYGIRSFFVFFGFVLAGGWWVVFSNVPNGYWEHSFTIKPQSESQAIKKIHENFDKQISLIENSKKLLDNVKQVPSLRAKDIE